MGDGRIIERGTHDELLRLDGEYADLMNASSLKTNRRYGVRRNEQPKPNLTVQYQTQIVLWARL